MLSLHPRIHPETGAIRGRSAVPGSLAGLLDTPGHGLGLDVLAFDLGHGSEDYGRRKSEKIEGTRNEFHRVLRDGYDLFEGKHDALVTDETWQAVRIRLYRLVWRVFFV